MGGICLKNYDRALDLLSGWDLETTRGKLQQYSEKVKVLNTHTELPVTRQNVVDAMKFHATDDEEFLSLVDDLEVIGQAFYNTAIHLKTLRALICNPYVYAQKMNMANREDAQFKSEASVKTLKELFIKEAVTVRTPVATPRKKRNQKKILHDLEDDSNSENSTTSSSDDDDDEDSAAIAACNTRKNTAELTAKQKGKSPKGLAGRISAGGQAFSLEQR